MKVDRIKLSEQQDRRIKLTSEDKDEVRRLYKTGHYSLNSLAMKFKVSKKLILLIVNPKSKRKSDQYIKEHWRDYYDREKRNEAARKTRAYKRELFKRGELRND